jgi:putative aminopeptidase FrvX
VLVSLDLLLALASRHRVPPNQVIREISGKQSGALPHTAEGAQVAGIGQCTRSRRSPQSQVRPSGFAAAKRILRIRQPGETARSQRRKANP